jgi:hypothetical protein
MRTKTVLVQYTITVCRGVPEDWDEHMVNFHQNEGTWCAGNLLNELLRVVPENGDEFYAETPCICHCTKAEYLREATQEDEENLPIICPPSAQ